MTLLARAPREVYRVYSEEEFFGEDGLRGGVAGAGLFELVGSPGTGERRLRRLAGVAALAGAVGAVGATFAATGPWPAAGAGRSAVADSHATALMRIAARASMLGARRPGEAAPPVRRLLASTGSLRPRGERRRPGASRDAGVPRWRGGEYARQYADAVFSTPHTAPVPVLARPNAAPMDVASANAIRAAAMTPQPQHAEFGFER
jgi:hypothetical protein